MVTTFAFIPRGESGLGGNRITSLYAAKSGKLYVGDGDGLHQYNFTTDHFERPPGTDSSELNKQHYTVTLMAEDAGGRIYIGCSEGLFRYTPRTALMEDMNKLIPLHGRIKYVSGLTFDKGGRLWITTQKQGFIASNSKPA
jgi:ligand-binding sensor domain-containing protein